MQQIIQKYNIKAKKSLWQNFLMDEKILDEIVWVSHIKNENIIEVWPGFWALTQKILKNIPKSLTLVELDTFMIDILKDRVKNEDLEVNGIIFEIINTDVLKFTPRFEDYKVIANIPYYITSPILHHFLYSLKNSPKEMIILMQKEVWERILSKKSSVLSLFVQKKCTTTEKIFVPKIAFSPAPKVDSLVLFFQKYWLYDDVDDEMFLTFIKAAFSNPRKKMINNLMSKGYEKKWLLQKVIDLWYDENVRAEDLSITDYIQLLKSI